MKTLSNRYSERRIRREREFDRRLLLFQNERILRDNGLSPELLREGVDAWPWRYDDDQSQEISMAGGDSRKDAVIHRVKFSGNTNPDSFSRTDNGSRNQDNSVYENEHSDAA